MAIVRFVVVMAFGCGAACGTKPPNKDLALVEAAVRSLLDETSKASCCDCTKYDNRGSIRCRLVVSRDELARLVKAFTLRPYDDRTGRYLATSPDPDHADWRADSCAVRDPFGASIMTSIHLFYGVSDAWCELEFTPLSHAQPDSSARSLPAKRDAL